MRAELSDQLGPFMDDSKKSLIGLSRQDMKAALVEIGVPEKQAGMRVSQLWHWLYKIGRASCRERV